MLAFQLPKLLGGSSSSEATATAADERRRSDRSRQRPRPRTRRRRPQRSTTVVSAPSSAGLDPEAQLVLDLPAEGSVRSAGRDCRRPRTTGCRSREGRQGRREGRHADGDLHHGREGRCRGDDRHRQRRTPGARAGDEVPRRRPALRARRREAGCEVRRRRHRRRCLLRRSEDDDAEGRKAAHAREHDDGRPLQDLPRLRRQRRSGDRRRPRRNERAAARRAGLRARRDAHRDRRHQRRAARDPPLADLRRRSRFAGRRKSSTASAVADKQLERYRALAFTSIYLDTTSLAATDSTYQARQRVLGLSGEPGVQPARRGVHALADADRSRRPFLSRRHVHRLGRRRPAGTA